MLKFPFQRFPFAAFTLHGVVLGHWLITPMKVAPPEKGLISANTWKLVTFNFWTQYLQQLQDLRSQALEQDCRDLQQQQQLLEKGEEEVYEKPFIQHHHLKLVLEHLALPKTAPPPMITELGSTPLQLLAQASVFPSESWKKHSGSKSWRSSSWPCRCRCCRHTPPGQTVCIHPR